MGPNDTDRMVNSVDPDRACVSKKCSIVTVLKKSNIGLKAETPPPGFADYSNDPKFSDK